MPDSNSLLEHFPPDNAMICEAMQDPSMLEYDWIQDIQTPASEFLKDAGNNRSFQFFVEFLGKKSPFERNVLMCIFMKDVNGSTDGDIWYNRFLQYVDPTDNEMIEKIRESYEVWKSLKLQLKLPVVPNETRLLRLWQCSLDPIMLEWEDSGFRKHILLEYGHCDTFECKTCNVYHRMLHKCMGLSLLDKHYETCVFRKFWVKMIKHHIRICKEMTSCGVCRPLEVTISVLNKADAMRHFDEEDRGDKIIEFMTSDFRQGAHMLMLDDCMSSSQITKKAFTKDDIDHLRYCNEPFCEYIYLCDHVRHCLIGHPLKCWIPDGYKCVDCDLFNVICAGHAKCCGEAKKPYDPTGMTVYTCDACVFINEQRRLRYEQMNAALEPGETLLTHFVNRLKELTPELREMGRYPEIPALLEDPIPLPLKGKPGMDSIPPAIPKHLLKDYNFHYLYKDKHFAIGQANPPELLVFFDYSDKVICPVCQMKHYCSLCQYRLLLQLQTKQKHITDFMTNIADMTLGELYKWSSVELVIKRCGERAAYNFELFKKHVFPDKNLPIQFWELLFKKDIHTSLDILEQRLDRNEYLPKPFVNNAKTKTKKLTAKSDKQKKKDLKSQQKKDGEIIYTVDGQCGKCSYYNTCEHCADLLHACCRDAVLMLKKILKDNNAYEDNQEEKADGTREFLQFVDIFRRIDQDQREMIGKRTAKLVEGLGDELLPVKFLDIFLNVDKDPKKFNANKAGRLWQELITCVQGRPVDYDAFFCHRRTKNDLSCIETRAPPPPRASSFTQRNMFNLEYRLNAHNSEPVVPLTNRLFYDTASPSHSDMERNPRSIKDACSMCPANSYCKDCKKRRLKFIKEYRTMAKRMIEIQKTYGVGQKCTKEYIVHQLNEEQLSQVKALGDEWSKNQNAQDKEFDPWSSLSELSTFNWAMFLKICDEQLANLQAGKRIKYTDINGIVTAVTQEHLPSTSASTSTSTSASTAPSTFISRNLMKQLMEQTGQNSTPKEQIAGQPVDVVMETRKMAPNGDLPFKNKGSQTHFVVNPKKKEIDPFPKISPDGYEIEWIDDVPMIILTSIVRKTKEELKKEKDRKYLESELEMQRTASHTYTCKNVAGCARCREFLMPVVLHYRNCQIGGCIQCEAAKRDTLEMYQHARYAKDIDFAYLLFAREMNKFDAQIERRIRRQEAQELERQKKMREASTQTERDDVYYQWDQCMVPLFGVVEQLPLQLPNTMPTEPPLRYMCILPENYRMGSVCYKTLNIHPSTPELKDFFARHIRICESHYKEKCSVCSLIVASYRYFNHLPLTCTLKKHFCYTCDAILETQRRHVNDCKGCPYCTELEQLIGKTRFADLKEEIQIRREMFERNEIQSTRIVHQRVGDADGFTFIRLREEQEIINHHTLWCLNPKCTNCSMEKSMDDFLDHIPNCPHFFNENCEICVNTGGNIAHHVLTCRDSRCLFCNCIRRDDSFDLPKMKTYHLQYAAMGYAVAKKYQPDEIIDDPISDSGGLIEDEYNLLFKELYTNCYLHKGIALPINPFGLRRTQYQVTGDHLVFAIDADSWRFNAYNFRPGRNKSSQPRLINKYLRIWAQDSYCYDPNDESQFDAVSYHKRLLKYEWPPIDRKRKMPVPANFDWEPFRGNEAREMISHAENCREKSCTICVKLNAFEDHSKSCQFDTPWSCELCVHFFHSRLEHLKSCGKCRYCQKVIKAWGKGPADYLCLLKMPELYTLVFFIRLARPFEALEIEEIDSK